MEKEWFEKPSWWFNSNPQIDKYLEDKYGHLIDDCENSTKLEQILVYDQLVRHVYRNQHANHIILWFLQKALIIAADIDINSLDDNHFCFALLPSRHSGNQDEIYKCMSLAWQRISSQSHIIKKFLRACYERAPLIGASLKNKLTQKPTFNVPNFVENLPNVHNKLIVISLSGGVDSMVCSLLLKSRYNNNKVIALHINYNNRETADEEERFVIDWCNKLNIECYVRKIHEIKRAPCMKFGLRDVYETYTRNIRYHSYKQFGEDAIIVMGHNKDDILENIFTNIASKSKYDNLDGMTTWSRQDNITFWRPLLQKSKSEIIEFAREHNIPHLPNSTPSWSMRGQIRNSIVPVLDAWHSEFIPSLYDLSDTMKDLYGMMESTIENIINSMQIMNGKKKFKMENMNQSIIFWRCFFNKLDVSVSLASIKNMCERLKSLNNKSSIQVVLSKYVTLYFNGENILEMEFK
jgi:tRNA(Ile)-lysidine synthetase-like protein